MSSITFENCAVGGICFGGGSIQVGGRINVTSNDEFDLPPLSEIFTGRDEEMQQLESLLFNEDKTKIQNKVVICGATGIGKSELAKQFANKYKEEGKVEKIYWINSEKVDKLQKSIKSLHMLAKGKKCLFILDNVVSKESITEFDLLHEHFYLITSQNKEWDDIKIIELKQFSAVPTSGNENPSSNPTTNN